MHRSLLRYLPDSIQAILQSPESASSEDHLRLIFRIASWVACVTVIFGIVLAIWPNDRFSLTYAIIVLGTGSTALVGLLLANIYIERGQPTKAVRLILYIVLTTQSFGLLFSHDGFYDPYIFSPTFLMILVGYYLSLRETWLVANVSVATVTLLFLLERFGFKVTPHPEPYFFQLFLYIAYMYILHWFLTISIGRLKYQSEALLTSEAALKAQQSVLEQEVERQTADLSQLLVEKHALISMLTHDMKSPLTTLGLFFDLVSANPQVIQEKPELIDNAVRGTEVLRNLVDNFLDVQQLQSGEMFLLHQAPFDLKVSVQKVIELHVYDAADRQITLTFSCPLDALLYTGDEAQLARVTSNLISNAVKYSPSPSPSEIVIRLDSTETQAVLMVEDQGYGIPASELPYIFDRYHRVDAHKEKATGTGLGLAIVKSIVEAHGGRISVETVLGEGSLFMVELPFD